MTLATDADVEQALAELPGWRREENALVREVQRRDFDDALSLVERIAAAAVDYGRRPDLCISEFNHVRITVANLHHAGLTVAELRLAKKVTATMDQG